VDPYKVTKSHLDIEIVNSAVAGINVITLSYCMEHILDVSSSNLSLVSGQHDRCLVLLSYFRHITDGT
jgi:hypothetical protein